MLQMHKQERYNIYGERYVAQTDIHSGESIRKIFTPSDKLLRKLNIKIKFQKVVKVYNEGEGE